MRVAVADIYDELLLERIRVESGCRVVPVQRTEAEIRRMLRADAQRNSEALLRELESGKKRDASSDSMPVISLVESILESALEQGATDIHFEPDSQSFKVRFRKDGLLHDYRALPAWIAEPILIRLKLLAQADITERRLPHDGSFIFQGAHTQANVRLSTLPVQYGEKCVLRLLPASDDAQTLDDLEFSPAIRQAFRNAFSAPQGLFLITGPTGSGKTTTLYAGLREIIHRDINVTTIEDPVEYTLHGANQVQVNEKCGFTFATALRSVLRQDPDVILIGEIRDSETAQIALRAAQTGHLVLATLHTNSARAAETRPQAIPRIAHRHRGPAPAAQARPAIRGVQGPYRRRRIPPPRRNLCRRGPKRKRPASCTRRRYGQARSGARVRLVTTFSCSWPFDRQSP